MGITTHRFSLPLPTNLLRYKESKLPLFVYMTITFYSMPFQTFQLYRNFNVYFALQPPCPKTQVWTTSFSLAITGEIIFIFFSSVYWDVSLQQVRLTLPMQRYIRVNAFKNWYESMNLIFLVVFIVRFNVFLRLFCLRDSSYALWLIKVLLPFHSIKVTTKRLWILIFW